MTLRPRALLAAAVGRDFEKVALGFLEHAVPGLVRPSSTEHWDRKGVDLMTDPSERPITVCFQCKSTGAAEFDRRAVRSILADIDKFLSNNIDCSRYIVALNRADNRGDIHAAVAELVRQRITQTRFEVWDLARIHEEAQAGVTSRVRAAISAFNEEWVEKLTGRFAPSGSWVRDVPLRTFRLMLDNNREPEMRERQDLEAVDAAALLLDRSRPRMSLLVGQFGSGKTTTALLASRMPQQVLYVPAASLDQGIVGSGTNGLTKEIARALGIRPADGEPTRVFLYLLGRGLSSVLRSDDEMVLIVDGLDENRAMRGIDGLRRLHDQLRDTRCRTILTTRTPHLVIHSGDLADTFVDFGRQGRRERGIGVVELRPWTESTVVDHVQTVANSLDPPESDRLQELAELIQRGEAERYYGTLLSHPIFLDLIIDDVVAERVREVGRSDLVRSWIRRKIARDQSKYAGPPLGGDLMTEARLIFESLEDVALHMSDPETRTPTERMAYDEFVRLLTGRGIDQDDVFVLLLKSVLITLGQRTSQRDAEVMFSHRVFHEFLIAAGLRRIGKSPPEGAPVEIREFWSELEISALPPAPVLGEP